MEIINAKCFVKCSTCIGSFKKRNNTLTKKIFETLRYFNESKKISNVHIARYFRYEPIKVFQPIHHYYEMKRFIYIKVLNFSFKKHYQSLFHNGNCL